MNYYITRQPILDRNVAVYGYELLFRLDMDNNSHFDSNMAYTKTIVDNIQTIDIEKITGGKLAFVRFTSSMLIKKTALLVSNERLVVEIIDKMELTPEVSEACSQLQARGYSIALDNSISNPTKASFNTFSRILMFDFISTSQREIQVALSTMDTKGKLLLAKGIETTEMFKFATKMGFHLFQGNFLLEPTTTKSKEPMPLKMSHTMLVKEINKPEPSFDNIAEIIRNDVALNYRLLRLVNSVYFGLRSKISEPRLALVYLGIKETRKWVSLIVMMGISKGKPDEIIRISMIRAHFMEELGVLTGRTQAKNALFLTGLFSMIDLLVNKSIDKALEELVLPNEVSDALLHQKGFTYDFLCIVKSIERCDWNEVDRLSYDISASLAQTAKTYLNAMKWSGEFSL